MRNAARAIPQVWSKTFPDGIVLLEILHAVKELVGLAVKKNIIPALLVERPYSVSWSNDIARCVLQVITAKAKAIALCNDGICGVAVSQLDGKNAFRAILESEVGRRGKELLHYEKAF